MTIDAGERSAMNGLDVLKNRKLLNDFTAGAREHLQAEARTAYCGFDPTGPSLQLGNLVPIIALRWLQMLGHRPILLIGGATGLIGDPSGKAKERPMADPAEVDARAQKIADQMKRFLDFDKGSHAAVLVNNAEWLSKMSVIDYVHRVCKQLSAKRIAAMESVRARWERDNEGISLAEFAYTSFQAWDWVELYHRYGCTVQVGGRDQWGNITLGADLVRNQLNVRAVGLTFPLLVDANGQKLGKSENGRIWLDPALTSPFAMHQYFLQASDTDAAQWLPSLSFIPDGELAMVLQDHARMPEQRLAQNSLADAVTMYVHGSDAVAEARRMAQVVFGDGIAATQGDLDQLSREPSVGYSTKPNATLVDVLVASGLAESKAEARRLIAQNGVSVNGQRPGTEILTIGQSTMLYDSFAILRRGKKAVRIVRVDRNADASAA